MKRKYDSYEVEIIISLGFLILFLISINFVSGYSFEQARRVQAIEYEKNVSLAAEFATIAIENKLEKLEYSEKLIRDFLREVALLTGFSDFVFIDTLNNVIALSSDGRPHDERTLEAKRAVKDRNGRTVGYVRLFAANEAGARLKELSRWDMIFRVGGLVSALIMGAYFLKAILLPYRRIKREALDYNFDLNEAGRKPGIEYIVDTFKDVINELEDKRARLEGMYNSSVKRADSLARYNEYILGSITSGVVICDSNGVVTRFNPSAQSILQYLEKDCRGRHYREVFGSEHQLVALFDDALLRRVVHSRHEMEVRRPDGKRLWLGCSSSLINDEHGEGMGVALLLIDLTEIRRLEELTSYSEKMVSLGETATGLAHEVRNSFAAIVGFAALMRKNPDQPKQVAKLAEAIKEESQASETLMSRFLSFAKPLNLTREQLKIGELLDSALALLTHPGLSLIKITKQISNELPAFWGDRMLLRQVFLNLLLNACDALPHGGEIRIKAGLKEESEKGEMKVIAISVIDNGLGISPEIAGRIFEPFVTDRAEGTGLGLALVKKTVVMHGGRVEVRSKPGKGTRFTIYLPLESTSINIPIATQSQSVSAGV